MLTLAGCSSKTSEETSKDAEYSGEAYSKEKDGIWVELALGKEVYDGDEDIEYSLNVKNDRKGYVISRVYVKPDHDDTLKEEMLPEFAGEIKCGDEKAYKGVIKSAQNVSKPAVLQKEVLPSSVETVTIRPYVKVNVGSEEKLVRYIVDVVMYQEGVNIAPEDVKNVKTVSCHDPSIVVGKDKEGTKCYYIFGSHRAWAKSYDLENWELFTNNLSTDYRKILEEPAKWSAHGSANYRVDGNMWAPDVMYNDVLGKWCMYLSVNGDAWYSSIVLLTADEIEGDWTYEGIVVYSGFRTDEFIAETDLSKVIGETAYPSRYSDKPWGDYYPNNIDPCVFFDDDHNLWMSYGSWSGGIFMLELDENTGLRDYSVTYEDSIHSDPYFGQKIAGGKYVSGEASYIQKIGDYYWLFMCYGGLEARGGYNVRVYRSDSPNGEYVDALGNTPFYDSYVLNFNRPEGIRLFGGYKWRTFIRGQVAQGHNSAFVDEDGKAYMVFHTRTTDGSEGHYVKVHQLFLNKEGWLVAAPYRTFGESVKEDGYSVSEVIGDYDVIIHNLDIDYANLDVKKPMSLTLNEDGSITGDMQGNWSLEEGTPYINITLDDCTYSGITLMMEIEDTKIQTMTFTALGIENQITVWGSKSID